MEFFLQSANVKKPGNLILEEYEMITFPTLVDYLQEGLRLKLMLGIDFTGNSNLMQTQTRIHSHGNLFTMLGRMAKIQVPIKK